MGTRKLIIIFILIIIIKTMGALLAKVINITRYYVLLFPLKIYTEKSNSIEYTKKNEEEVIIEWGQFTDISKPLYNDNRESL
tara:strand:+ start:1506 stop:1751 length:246 start_codon:yes stop_codon:yes gene_type:complete